MNCKLNKQTIDISKEIATRDYKLEESNQPLSIKEECKLKLAGDDINMSFAIKQGQPIATYLAINNASNNKKSPFIKRIIKLKFHLDPYSRCMFDFCNRRRTSIKILQWDGSGFWIFMKKLDRNSFHWPDTPDELQKVTLKEMHWLCDGLSLNPQGAFKERHPKIIV